MWCVPRELLSFRSVSQCLTSCSGNCPSTSEHKGFQFLLASALKKEKPRHHVSKLTKQTRKRGWGWFKQSVSLVHKEWEPFEGKYFHISSLWIPITNVFVLGSETAVSHFNPLYRLPGPLPSTALFITESVTGSSTCEEYVAERVWRFVLEPPGPGFELEPQWCT